MRLVLLTTPSTLLPCAAVGRPFQVPVYPAIRVVSWVTLRPCMGRPSTWLVVTVVPMVLTVAVTSGVASPATSTVCVAAPTVRVAFRSVVWAACTVTLLKTWVSNPGLLTESEYAPSGKFTNL